MVCLSGDGVFMYRASVSGIKRLVYTSTTNVIFCGRPIHGGDESLPYADVQDMVDPYSQTKRIAEDMVCLWVFSARILYEEGSEIFLFVLTFSCIPLGVRGSLRS